MNLWKVLTIIVLFQFVIVVISVIWLKDNQLHIKKSTATTKVNAPQGSTNLKEVSTQPINVQSVPDPVMAIENTAQATEPPSPQIDPNACIIQIDGHQYDISQFRKIHNGGDIFQCGTDMTDIFYNQHDSSYLLSLSPYQI